MLTFKDSNYAAPWTAQLVDKARADVDSARGVVITSRWLPLDVANVVAAAPELHAALASMLAWFGGADPADVEGNAVLDAAIAALAKAEGRTLTTDPRHTIGGAA